MRQRQTPDPFGEITIARPEPVVGPRPAAEGRGVGPPPGPRPPLPRPSLLPGLRRWAPRLLAGGLLLYLFLGYLLVPYLLRVTVPQALGRRLDRPVTIGLAEFDPLSLRLTLNNGIVGPRLSDPADKVDPILSFSRLTVRLAVMRSLVERAVVCRELTLDRPFLHLVRGQDQRFNTQSLTVGDFPPVLALLGRLAAFWSRRYSLNNLALDHGELIYDDLPSGKTHTVRDLDLSLPVLANIDYQEGGLAPSFRALVDGAPIEMRGQARLGQGPVAATLNLKMTDLDLTAYAGYLPARLGIQAVSGRADLDLTLTYDARDQAGLRLAGSAALRSAQIDGPWGQLHLESGRVRGWLAPFGGRFHAEEISLNQPFWQRQAEGGPPWRDIVGVLLGPAAGEGAARPAIDHLRVSQGDIRTLAASAEQSRDWQAIDLSLDVSGPAAGGQGVPAQVLFSLTGHDASGCGLNLQGSAITDPFAVKGLAVISGMGQGELRDLGQAAGLALPVAGGTVEQLQANFTLGREGGRQLALSLAPLSVQAKDLVLEEGGQRLAVPVWQSEQGSFSLADRGLNLGRVHLEQAALVVRRQSDDGGIRGFWGPAASGQTAVGPSAPEVTISGLTLENSSLRLINQGPPDIELNLARLDLKVDGLEAGRAHGFTVAAMLDDQWPVQGSGSFTLSPFAARLNLQASDLPLSDFAPVLSRYFALPMQGRLAVDGVLSLPSLNYQGGWTITDLAAPPFSCRQVRGEGTALVLRPLSFSLDKLTLDGPSLQITASDRAMPRFPTLWQPGWAPVESGAPARVAVKRIELSDGTLIYDFPGPPGLMLTTRKLSGSFADCLAVRGQGLPFSLAGEVEGAAEFAAQGTLSPFTDPPGLTLGVSLKGLPLTSLAPALEPSWGFTVQGGRLDFANRLTLADNQLHDQAQFVLAGLKLGRPLAAEAIRSLGSAWRNLPLAQAAMQDAGGKIAFTVPIDGRIDAGFTYQEGLRNYLNQVLLKAAVSPERLLGEGRPLPEAVAFAPGSARVPAAAEDGLRRLAVVLQGRPLLAARLSASADRLSDLRALSRALGEAAARADEALMALAGRRGQAVASFLLDQGVADNQLRRAEPQVTGPGESGLNARRVAIELAVAAE